MDVLCIQEAVTLWAKIQLYEFKQIATNEFDYSFGQKN